MHEVVGHERPGERAIRRTLWNAATCIALDGVGASGGLDRARQRQRADQSLGGVDETDPRRQRPRETARYE